MNLSAEKSIVRCICVVLLMGVLLAAAPGRCARSAGGDCTE